MRRRRALAAGFISGFAALLLALIAGGVGTSTRPAMAAYGNSAPQLSRQQTSNPTTDPGLQLPPLLTLPPDLQFTLPPDKPQQTATPAPTPIPTETPLPSVAPVPTGPAVGSEVTPPAQANPAVATIGPAPQPAASDVTLVIVIVIIGLSLLAIGAFVLALAVQ